VESRPIFMGQTGTPKGVGVWFNGFRIHWWFHSPTDRIIHIL